MAELPQVASRSGR